MGRQQANSANKQEKSGCTNQADELKQMIQEVKNKMSKLIENLAGSLKGLVLKQVEMERELNNTKLELTRIDKSNEEMSQLKQDWVVEMEKHRQLHVKNNIRVFKLDYTTLKEFQTERESFIQFCNEELSTKLNQNDIDDISCIGQAHRKHLLVRFHSWRAKLSVLKGLHKLKGSKTKVSFQDDLTKHELSKKRINLPIFKQMKQNQPSWKVELRRGDIFVNGKLHNETAGNN